MADKKYYCFCETGCKYETMSKEQILAAIMQAVENGTVGNCDTGFIQTIKTVNGLPLRFFVGTQYDYEALEDKENLFAIITNDATMSGILEAIEDLQKNHEEFSDFANKRLTQKTVFSDVANDYHTMKQNVDLKLFELPVGKTLDDIVGLSLNVKYYDDYYKDDRFLFFTGGKSMPPTYNEYKEREEVTFYLSSPMMANTDVTKGSFSTVYLYVDDTNFVHAIIYAVDFWSYAKMADYHQIKYLNNGDFCYGGITYWFA